MEFNPGDIIQYEHMGDKHYLITEASVACYMLAVLELPSYGGIKASKARDSGEAAYKVGEISDLECLIFNIDFSSYRE